MLVLTRRPSERLAIDGEITVKVLSVSGDRVRLGIQAAEAMVILRQELLRCAARSPRPEGPGSVS
jgi:carbon storage regulator